MFKTLVGKEIAVELKNDVALTGTLHSIDQYLNIKLLDARVVDAARHPQLVAVSSVFVRGSVVRYDKRATRHCGRLCCECTRHVRARSCHVCAQPRPDAMRAL